MTTKTATALVDVFAAASGKGVWPGLDRATLAADLKKHLAGPGSVNQADSPHCGPSSFTRALIIDMPDAYAQAAIDLFNTGEATVGTLKIKPGDTVRKSAPLYGTSPADWIMLASIRDTNNSIFSTAGFFGGSAAGITLPGTIAGWFKSAGFATVIDHAYVVQSPQLDTVAAQLRQAHDYRTSGHHVVMLIDANVMSHKTQDDIISTIPNHWVTLTSAITDGGLTAYHNPISMQVFCWGKDDNPIPADPMSKPPQRFTQLKKIYFLNKFYGYIAVKK